MPRSWFSIQNKSADTAEIDIFDEIGAWGITAKDFVTKLRSMAGLKEITLNIDCPGGDCNDGFTIYDAIRTSGANVTAHITGLAASMASVIMLAAKTITIAENGRVMIHRVTAGVGGNADDIEAVAKVSRQMEDRIVALYVSRTGKDEVTIRDWMKASMGTWFFGKEAIDAGFADSVAKGTKAKAFNPRWVKALPAMLPAALLIDNAPDVEPPHSDTMTAEEIKAAQDKLAADQKALADAQKKLADDQKALADLTKEQEDKAKAAPADVAKLVADAVKPLADRLAVAETALKSGVAGAAGGRSALENKGTEESDDPAIKLANEYDKAAPKDRSAILKKHGAAALLAACNARDAAKQKAA